MESSAKSTAAARARTSIYVYSAIVGIASGFIVVAYRFAIASLESARAGWMPFFSSSLGHTFTWVAAAAGLGLVTSLLVARSPLIKGSGIPQVKAFLLRRVDFDWVRELPFKFAGGAMALGTGLSLGREGPSIQLGALAGKAVSDLTGRSEFQRYLVTAGASAGISAAFNAPLAAVLFGVEELHRHVSPVMLTGSLIASFSANAVMWAFFGANPVFDVRLVDGVLPFDMYFPAVLVIGLATGLAGSFFNRGILVIQAKLKEFIPNERLRIVSVFAAAGLVALWYAPITGGGNELVASLIDGNVPLSKASALFAGKLAFTLVCFASGTPGGIFLPVLSLGALAGALCDFIFIPMGLPDQFLANYILIGMVGFFTAVVRAPITGAVLITEMAGSFAHFPAFMLVSVIASLVASVLGARPIYDCLLEQLKPSLSAKVDKTPITLDIPVFEDSILDNASSVAKVMPEGCILTAVQRGDEEIFPDKALEIHPGDSLRVVVERGRASELKERLLELGRRSKSGVEGE